MATHFLSNRKVYHTEKTDSVSVSQMVLESITAEDGESAEDDDDDDNSVSCPISYDTSDGGGADAGPPVTVALVSPSLEHADCSSAAAASTAGAADKIFPKKDVAS